jgi:hypothetical protein
MLIEYSIRAAGSFEIFYQNQAGLAVQVIQGPAHESRVSVEAADAVRVAIGQDEILLQQEDPLTDSVYRAVWERQDVFFDLWVARSPSLGLSHDQAIQIIQAFIAQE